VTFSELLSISFSTYYLKQRCTPLSMRPSDIKMQLVITYFQRGMCYDKYNSIDKSIGCYFDILALYLDKEINMILGQKFIHTNQQKRK
jgi:hypothetical protein